MAHPIRHAESSSRKFGGGAEAYLALHRWFDQSKAHFPDFRHRALLHHTAGIFLAEAVFGVSILNSEGRAVPVRYLGEQHVVEDLGRIPTLQDWLVNLKPTPWMFGQKLNPEPGAAGARSRSSRTGSGAETQTAEESR